MERRGVEVVFLHVIIDAICYLWVVYVLADVVIIVVFERAMGHHVAIIERVDTLVTLTRVAWCIYRSSWAVPGGLVVILYLFWISRPESGRRDIEMFGGITSRSYRFRLALLLCWLLSLAVRLKLRWLECFENTEIFWLIRIWPIFCFFH